MKQLLSSGFFLLFLSGLCSAQDTTTLFRNENMAALMQAETPDVGKESILESPSAPQYATTKSEVQMTRFESDQNEPCAFQESGGDTSSAKQLPNRDLFAKGQADAVARYQGYITPRTVTFLVGMVSPIVGLIPAIVSSSNKHTKKDLARASPSLLKEPDYYRGYTQKATKIRRDKVWKNWGIAFGVNVLLLLAYRDTLR